MHDIVVFSLIIASVFRIIGIFVAYDFYLESKAFKYKQIIVGWFLWLIGGLIPLTSFVITNQQLSEILLLYNALITTLGVSVLSFNLVSNYLSINKSFLIGYLVILFILSHILYFIGGYSLSISFTGAFQQVMWMFFMALPIIMWKKFKVRVERNVWYNYFVLFVSGVIYLPIAVIIGLQGYKYGLYSSNDTILIILNYGYLLTITLLIQILIIHIKFRETLAEKRELKDKYSHNLGNAMQAIYTALELTENYEMTEQDENLVRKTSQGKIKEAAELLKEIRDL